MNGGAFISFEFDLNFHFRFTLYSKCNHLTHIKANLYTEIFVLNTAWQVVDIFLRSLSAISFLI
jgi:hypothetical protein